MWFANDFHLGLHNLWKSLANYFTQDEKVIIHGNSCIILYINFVYYHQHKFNGKDYNLNDSLTETSGNVIYIYHGITMMVLQCRLMMKRKFHKYIFFCSHYRIFSVYCLHHVLVVSSNNNARENVKYVNMYIKLTNNHIIIIYLFIKRSIISEDYTVQCRCTEVQFIMILLMALRWPEQNSNQISNSQQTPHTSPSWVSYGVSVVMTLEKTDCIIMALYCIWVTT